MHGNVDNDGNLSARFNQGWNADNVSKVQAQVCVFYLLSPLLSYCICILDVMY